MHYRFSTQTFNDGYPTGSGWFSVIADNPEEAAKLAARRRADYALHWDGGKMETAPMGEGQWCECCRPKDQPNANSRQEMSADISPQAE